MSDKKLVMVKHADVTNALITELGSGGNKTLTEGALSANGLALETLRRTLYLIKDLGFVIAKPVGDEAKA